MTEFRIFQIDRERDTQRLMFTPYDETIAIAGKVEPWIYDLVYSGKSDEVESLEDIFALFNLYRPEGFNGHSLSVSDVIHIISSDVIEQGVYFVDSFGFKKLVMRTYTLYYTNDELSDGDYSIWPYLDEEELDEIMRDLKTGLYGTNCKILEVKING